MDGEVKMKVKVLRIVIVAFAALLLSGCATQFTGSAPADDGYIYVTGSRQMFLQGMQPAVWRCPASSPGECENVNVND